MKATSLASFREPALSIMRAAVGLMFMTHGLQKTLGWLGGTQVSPLSLAGVAGYLELIGGILIMIGFLTRAAAFLLSGEMAYAYFTAHVPNGLWPIVNHGELAVLYCFIFFYLIFSGGGAWSLDAALRPGVNPHYS